MADIVRAIAKEKEYLKYRMKGEEPYHLVDAVKEFGFESLKEYFEAKRDYEFAQVNFTEVVETTPDKGVYEIFKAIENQEPKIGFMNFDRTVILYGNRNDTNLEYCKECGIPVIPYQAGGGTIVAAEGDINVGICVPESAKIDLYYIMERLSRMLKKYTDKTVEIAGNDMMVDGKKVFGAAEYKQNNMYVFATTISLSDRSDLISKICLKHSTKQVGYIDFMTKEDIKREVLGWVKSH